MASGAAYGGLVSVTKLSLCSSLFLRQFGSVLSDPAKRFDVYISGVGRAAAESLPAAELHPSDRDEKGGVRPHYQVFIWGSCGILM